eukprot:589704-Pleurochrysis_carterae.AAC.1
MATVRRPSPPIAVSSSLTTWASVSVSAPRGRSSAKPCAGVSALWRRAAGSPPSPSSSRLRRADGRVSSLV